MTLLAVADEARQLPMSRRIELVHAYVQIVADTVGVDVLHLKGAAVHPQLRDGARGSLDVDVLVRPAHVETLVRELEKRGWTRMTGFDEGSAFGHAMNLRHALGMIDLHRRWPGFDMDAERAFDLLWEQREHLELAHVSCVVPDLTSQRLVLLLHYGRSGGQRAEDRDRSWNDADVQTRMHVQALAARFNAQLAFAAATGHLEDFHDEREYRLWKYFSHGGGSRVEEWSARWAAARGLRQKAGVLTRFVRVNPDLLRLNLGREPTTRDYVVAQIARCGTAVMDVVGLVSHGLHHRGGRR